jgi:hypothetical protein
MPAIKSDRERPEKILVAMLELSGGEPKPLKYEDIVVKAFELFPDEFALRGYPKYPDSSDIHKPLYGPLKRHGLIRSGNKTFALTEKGFRQAQELKSVAGAKLDEKRDPNRLGRDKEKEVDRMLGTEAVKFFESGETGKIIDNDFFAFLGCTVRTDKNEFIGRIETIEQAMGEALKLKRPDPIKSKLLLDAWAHLKGRFKAIIDRKKGNT